MNFISKDECLDAYELSNGYALIPKKLYFNSRLKSKLKNKKHSNTIQKIMIIF